MRYLGLAALKNEGAPTVFDNQAGERYIYNQYHKEIGLGYAFTRRMVDDNLYKRQWRPSNLGLQKSFNQTKEIYGATPLNTATTYDPSVLGDQQPLCSLNHPIDGGVVSEPLHDRHGSQRGARSSMRQASIRGLFRDNAGLRMQARATRLVVPIALEPIAIRLLKTVLRPGTSDNDVNAILETSRRYSGWIPRPRLSVVANILVRPDRSGRSVVLAARRVRNVNASRLYDRQPSCEGLRAVFFRVLRLAMYLGLVPDA